jgi:hypothetical protein
MNKNYTRFETFEKDAYIRKDALEQLKKVDAASMIMALLMAHPASMAERVSINSNFNCLLTTSSP